jgi:hypothetical protein
MPDEQPVDPATEPAATDEAAEAEPLPAHKDDLVALAIERGIPSYEAWDMTVPQLKKRLES